MLSGTGRAAWLRPLLVRIHRYTGLAIALFLAVAGATGTLLSFYYEIDHGLNPQLFEIEPVSRPLLSLQQVAAIVNDTYPDSRIRVISLNRKEHQSLRVSLVPKIDPLTRQPYPARVNEVYLNPYTGQIVGERNRGAFRLDRQHIMPFIYKLHYSLHLPGRWGEWLFGIASLLWMATAPLGFYLTLPANPQASNCPLRHAPRKGWFSRWLQAWKIKRGASATRFNFDLHRAGGLWFCGILLIVAMSGLALTLGNEIFRPVVGAFGKITPDNLVSYPNAPDSPAISYDEALAQASTHLPGNMRGMLPVSIRHLPNNRAFAVFFARPGFREEAFNIGLERIFIDSADGRLISHQSYLNGTAADKFLGMQFSLHTGQILGLPGRILICLSAAMTVAMVWTGIMLWRRKVRSSVRRPRSLIQRAI